MFLKNSSINMDFKGLELLYKEELLESVIPFWFSKSQDYECGGYFTCLDREGNVFDTDKLETSSP